MEPLTPADFLPTWQAVEEEEVEVPRETMISKFLSTFGLRQK